jgi:hypothetical protein
MAFEEGPQEQTSIGIPSIQLQYWLASQPEPCSEGLNVFKQINAEVEKIHNSSILRVRMDGGGEYSGPTA